MAIIIWPEPGQNFGPRGVRGLTNVSTVVCPIYSTARLDPPWLMFPIIIVPIIPGKLDNLGTVYYFLIGDGDHHTANKPREESIVSVYNMLSGCRYQLRSLPLRCLTHVVSLSCAICPSFMKAAQFSLSKLSAYGCQCATVGSRSVRTISLDDNLRTLIHEQSSTTSGEGLVSR